MVKCHLLGEKMRRFGRDPRFCVWYSFSVFSYWITNILVYRRKISLESSLTRKINKSLNEENLKNTIHEKTFSNRFQKAYKLKL